MNQEKARSILRMFSGVAEVKTLDPLLDEAVALVKSRLRPGADTERPQLDYLCAAIANLRHSQLLAAQSQLTYILQRVHQSADAEPDGGGHAHRGDPPVFDGAVCSARGHL